METRLFDNETMAIGEFRLAANDPKFCRLGFVKRPLIVFPRHSIWIKHPGEPAFVADASVINLYNHQQPYQRHVINQQGDWCHWIEPSVWLLSQLSVDHIDTPFEATHFHCSLSTYLTFQQLLLQVEHTPKPDPLILESLVMDIVSDIGHAMKKPPNNDSIKPAHRQLVQRIKQQIHDHLFEPHSLHKLAQAVHSSPYHVCRVFKQVTHLGIHRYKNQLRLKWAYQIIAAGQQELSRVALDAGFSSHSHFTHQFRQYFGMTPKQLKTRLN